MLKIDQAASAAEQETRRLELLLSWRRRQAEGDFQPLATVLTNTTAAFTAAQETKLAGVATGATANSTDAFLLARANHTGTQTAATVSDFSTAADARVAVHAALTSAHGISAFGETLVDDANAAAARTTLGLGTAALSATGDFAVAAHTHTAADINAGTMATARLGSGTANATTYLRGDQTWATPAASVSITAATVTVPYAERDYLATVTDAAVSGASKIILAPGFYAQTDQNSPADVDAYVESVGAGSFGLRLTSRPAQFIGGEFKFLYTVS